MGRIPFRIRREAGHQGREFIPRSMGSIGNFKEEMSTSFLMRLHQREQSGREGESNEQAVNSDHRRDNRLGLGRQWQWRRRRNGVVRLKQIWSQSQWDWLMNRMWGQGAGVRFLDWTCELGTQEEEEQIWVEDNEFSL